MSSGAEPRVIPHDNDLRLDVRLPAYERWLVREAVRRATTRGEAARMLGISVRSLYHKLHSMKLDGALHVPYRRTRRKLSSTEVGMGSTGSSGSESTNTTESINTEQAQRIGRTVRDRVTQALEQKLQGRTGQVTGTEVREILQQIDFGRFVQEASQEAPSMRREESTSGR